MAFVVPRRLARRFDEEHPVAEPLLLGDDDTAHDGSAVLRGPAAQGRDHRSVIPFGHTGRGERESRGEQLGQQHDVRIGRGDHRFEPREVPRGLFPGDVALAEGDADSHSGQSL